MTEPEVKEEVIKESSSVKEELETLKEIADRMGIKYSNNIGVDALKAKIEAIREEKSIKKEEELSTAERRKKLKEEQLKLVRIRLTCLNPAEKAKRGKIITIGNSIIGSCRKFIPYDPSFYKDGYHVPYCIYKVLEESTFQDTRTEEKNGQTIVHKALAKEFGITVLPPLTEEELKELAKAQQAGNRIDKDDV